MNIRKNGLSFSSVSSNQKLRRSDSTCSATNLKAEEFQCRWIDCKHIDSACCSAKLVARVSHRSEWIIFKELYKECSDRNSTIEFIPEPASDRNATVKSIPVPGMRCLDPLQGRRRNYDMDSEDEEWLKKFNVDLELHDHVSEDKFELMVDAFEKAFYSKPYDFSDGNAAG
ncbi:hypothetical protein M0R45_035857 [Rubus argutus]|uniref:Enhancer of polycomb-like protein n=1 Tax=Rubus argutus TaxID=59490 RepID=A0AAW1VZL7_RUBAR